MPDRPNFPIPDELTPDTFCLCLQIPNNEIWKQVFAGLLAQPMYWFNWQRDPDHSGKILSQYWQTLFDQIDWSTMSCCCDQPPAIFRYNSDGVYQRSTDGGVTWVDAPEYDYRNTSIIFPPPSALGIDNTKCQAADSAVVVLNEDVIQGLDDGSAVQALLEFVAAVLIFYLSAGTLATVSIGLFSMAAAIIGYGVAATKAAFTSTILDQLRCTLFCNMDSDSSIDAAGLARILDDINTNYTGIVKTSLYSIISAAGAVGITNMMRSNRGDPAADCSGCPCDCSANIWDVVNYLGNDLGIVTGRTDTTMSITSVSDPVFGGVAGEIIIRTFSDDACCHITSLTFPTGETGADFQIFVVNCGDQRWPASGDPNATLVVWDGSQNANTFYIRKLAGGTVPFKIVITFAA